LNHPTRSGDKSPSSGKQNYKGICAQYESLAATKGTVHNNNLIHF